MSINAVAGDLLIRLSYSLTVIMYLTVPLPLLHFVCEALCIYILYIYILMYVYLHFYAFVSV